MTDAEKREKVIRSLETAVKNFERYSGDEYGREYDYARVEVETLEDALALLKAQEPRVMDFDEVVSGDECWLEAVNGACGYADCYACTGTGEVQIFRCKYDNPQYITASDYLKTWRCWTQRPTDEQREAAAWES